MSDGSGKESAPDTGRRHRAGRVVVLGLADVSSLLPLGAFDDFKFDSLTLFEGPKTRTTDGRIVDEYVASAFTLNKAVALGVVEPLDLACNGHRSSSLLALHVSVGKRKKTAHAYAVSTTTSRERLRRKAILGAPPKGCQEDECVSPVTHFDFREPVSVCPEHY